MVESDVSGEATANLDDPILNETPEGSTVYNFDAYCRAGRSFS